jgi:iron only hydrogenase large subunit-like protein
MPCYDKKLEAVRPEFKLFQEESKEAVKEVDMVLATHELIDLLNHLQINLNEVKPFVHRHPEPA